jgi:hypothetical protein
VIVASRDEGKAVEAATRSLLAQGYPDLQVVAVDDRSTDDTGTILDRLAAEDARLTVLHVTSLPEGWLGKNHALWLGAARARGAWLLFTDGDVQFEPDAIQRALLLAERHGLGHVVALARLRTHGLLERAFVGAFAIFLNLKLRLWELPVPRTRGFVGTGAFNLVRRDAYERVGGHRTLALEVVDDAKLGLVLRRSGVPQGAADSRGLVSVRWQEGFLATLRGLVKNAFAVTEYRPAVALGGVFFILAVSVVPIVVAASTSDAPTRGIALAAAALPALLVAGAVRRAAKGTGLEGLLFAPCAALLAGVVLWSTAAALVRGGVVWRGTLYPLALLRKGCVRERDWPVEGAVGWPRP